MKPALTFEIWKERLREDCRRVNKAFFVDNVGDYVLGMLWSLGIEPTVRAIIADGESATANPTSDA